jgi:hypothetical protein
MASTVAPAAQWLIMSGVTGEGYRTSCHGSFSGDDRPAVPAAAPEAGRVRGHLTRQTYWAGVKRAVGRKLTPDSALPCAEA